ncbi:hypothetical protein CFP71_21910 [Amycolatopsis thailandensis]|uniref:Uncharacterized protein n=1 Tax=Amycolatopsis thailandensis TaxID=589330 RepID=A0A229S393_9PSEU|nr:hypothetical protein CFP71_21910 [Amycolatopsis thailandensis]
MTTGAAGAFAAIARAVKASFTTLRVGKETFTDPDPRSAATTTRTESHLAYPSKSVMSTLDGL